MGAGVIADECYRCGYDLRGIADDQPCPECGLLTERSRRPTDELHNTHPRWLRKLSWGVWLILLSFLLAALWPAVSWDLVQWLYAYSKRTALNIPIPPLQIMLQFGFDAGAVILFVGVMLLTAREGDEHSDRANFRRRVMLRIAAAMPFIALILQHAVVEWQRIQPVAQAQFYVEWPWWWVLVPLFLTFGCVPLPALLFFQLRSLAKRARSAHLIEHCAIVGIGASISMFIIACITCMYMFPENSNFSEWESRSNRWLILMLLAGTASGLFLLWMLYVLVRFAVAFHRASRRLQRQWKRDDRALTPSA